MGTFFGIDVVLLASLALGFFVVPWGQVGQAARILSRRLGGDPAVKALAAEQEEYDRLQALLPEQQESVQRVTQNAVKAREELGVRTKAVADCISNFNEAKARKAGDEELEQLSRKYGLAKRAVTRQEAVLVSAEQAAVDMRAILDETIESATALGQKLDQHKITHELTKALEISAKAKELMSGLGEGGSAETELSRKLEEARARGELAKGTTKTEDELQQLDDKARDAAVRAELEALATTSQG